MTDEIKKYLDENQAQTEKFEALVKQLNETCEGWKTIAQETLKTLAQQEETIKMLKEECEQLHAMNRKLRAMLN